MSILEKILGNDSIDKQDDIEFYFTIYEMMMDIRFKKIDEMQADQPKYEKDYTIQFIRQNFSGKDKKFSDFRIDYDENHGKNDAKEEIWSKTVKLYNY
jgi:hypothetical protein